MALNGAHIEEPSTHVTATRAAAPANETTIIITTTTTTIVRSNTTTETTTTTTTTTQQHVQPFRFLDLPAELRMQVYEYLVIVGKVFYTPDQYEEKESCRFKAWKKYAVPALQVLRVNKQIHREAEDLYLSRNLFVLPWNFEVLAPFNTSTNDGILHRVCQRSLFSSEGLKVIKSISVSFCTRSTQPLTMTASDWYNGLPSDDFEYLSAKDRLSHAHGNSIVWGEDHMGSKSYSLACIQSKLQHLEIDFTNAYCPVGCCRMVDFDGDVLTELEPAMFRVLGVKEREEEDLRDLLLSCPLSEESRPMIQCNPKDDPWARYATEAD